MNSIRLPSLVLAALIQLAPVARVIQTALPFQESPLAIVLRWVVGAVAVAGAFHTVSGATATTIKVSGTNGTMGVSMTMRIVITEVVNGRPNTYTPDAWTFNGKYAISGSLSNGIPIGQRFVTSTGIINGKAQESGTFPVHLIAYRFDTNGTPLGSFKLVNGKLEPQASIPLEFTITVTPNPDFPAITVQPVGSTVNAGDPISLSVTATGSGTLVYQWIHDGQDVPSGTAPTLNIASAAALDAGSYSVRVTNTLGRVVSGPAVVVVNEVSGPVISAHPQNATLHPGEAMSMSVTATAPGEMTFQWKRGESDVEGATSATLTLPAVQTADAGDYVAVVTSGGTSVTSNPGTLTVIPLLLQTPVVGAAEVTLTFSSIAGRNYTLEANSSLDPLTWGTLTQVSADAATESATDPIIDQGLRVWRVRAAP